MSTARAMKLDGVKRGVPDIICPFPNELYCGLAIEMKWGKNTQTPEQKAYQKALQKFGWRYVLCYSANEALQATAEYLNIELPLI